MLVFAGATASVLQLQPGRVVPLGAIYLFGNVPYLALELIEDDKPNRS
jgi:hypothetical protein